MIRQVLGRGLIAVALVVGASVGPARAQDPRNGVSQTGCRDRGGQCAHDEDEDATQPAISKPRSRRQAKHDEEGQSLNNGCRGVTHPKGVGRWLPWWGWGGGNNCGWSTHNEFNTGNFRSEWVFLWGGSRVFFGEPYVKGPPIYPFPLWPSYQTAPGYPGYLGWEGSAEYPICNHPPGYACRPYPPNAPVERKKDCAGAPQPQP